MILASPMTALALALTLSPEVDTSASRAKSLYAEGRYEEAAALFDRLWEEEGASKYLYNAAAAHEAAGRDVPALIAYLHYLHLDEVDPKEWREVKDRVGQLRARLVPVSVILTPGALRGMATLIARRSDNGATVRVDLDWLDASSGAEGTLHLSPGLWLVKVEIQPPAGEHYEPGRESPVYVPLPGEEAAGAAARLIATPVESALTLRLGPSEGLRRAVEIRLYDQLGVEATIEMKTREAEVRIPLRSGPWRYVVRGRGRQEVSGEVEVTRGGGDVVERVLGSEGGGAMPQLRSTDRWDRRQRQALGAGLAGAGLVLMGSGATMVGVANQRIPTQVDVLPPEDTACLRHGLCRSFMLGLSGAGVLGAAFGIEVAAATELLNAKKRRVWVAEMGSGGAISLAGAVWATIAMAKLAQEEEPEEGVWSTRVSTQRQHGFIAVGLIGAGVGMVIGSGLGLMALQKTRTRVVAGPANGVSIQHRF